MMSGSLVSLLQPPFAAVHVAAAVKHYEAMVGEFQRGAWEESIGKGGKFVEAALKGLWLHTGSALPPARQFKADSVINQLAQTSGFHDSVRLTIPRACRFVYDIASNRGARHDTSEIDPNEMDAHVVVASVSWMLAELVRYAQQGALNPTEVKALVDSLVEKKYPLVEDVEGRTYMHVRGASAREIALLLLWHQHPRRISRDDLIAAVARHDYTPANAAMAVGRLRRVVDIDSHGNLRLLQPGIQEAEMVFAGPHESIAKSTPLPRRRRSAKRRRSLQQGIALTR